MSQPFRTDSLRPSSLPSATLGRRRPHQSSSTAAFATAEGEEKLVIEEKATRLLEKEHDRWNERIDRDIKGCVDGLKELVQLADISESQSNSLTASTLGLRLPVRTNSLIRSALNIRDMAHELKLLLLLSDRVGQVQARDRERHAVDEEITMKRENVEKIIMELSRKGKEDREIKDETADKKEKHKHVTGQEQESKPSSPGFEINSSIIPPTKPTRQRPDERENMNDMEVDNEDRDFEIVEVPQESNTAPAPAPIVVMDSVPPSDANAISKDKSSDSLSDSDQFEEIS
ncbi:hypothetical protein L204_101022 [Cryptococcus depauperatus]|nr:hypothetical protein L204_01048 [Cryptococcus depauperatus CBS 7855]